MFTRTTPEHGDIVIRRDMWESRIVYVMHAVPGADQFLLRARDEAIAQALTFARHQGVRVWLSEGGQDCTLVDDFRIVRSV